MASSKIQFLLTGGRSAEIKRAVLQRPVVLFEDALGERPEPLVQIDVQVLLGKTVLFMSFPPYACPEPVLVKF